MRALPKSRLLTIPLLWLPGILGLWIYGSTRDWGHFWRQYEMGHPSWSPHAKLDAEPETLTAAQHALAVGVHVAAIAAAVGLGLALVVLASRAVHRRHRMRAMDRWELRLSLIHI